MSGPLDMVRPRSVASGRQSTARLSGGFEEAATSVKAIHRVYAGEKSLGASDQVPVPQTDTVGGAGPRGDRENPR